MPTERVLIEIVTAANLAGVKQAKAGFLGMNVATLGLAAGLSILVMGAKSMIDIAEKHDAAMLDLAQAYASTKTNLDKYQGGIDKFIASNGQYISNQSDVIEGYATLTRAGLTQTQVQRDMNIALDLAAMKHIDLSAAIALVNGAEHGRVRGLVDLGITSAKYVDSTGKVVNANHNMTKVMAELDAKTKGGRDTLTSLQKSSNKLSNDWQDLSQKGGPVLTTLLDTTVNLVSGIYDGFDRLGKDDALWGAISDRLVKLAGLSASILPAWMLSTEGHPNLATSDPHKNAWVTGMTIPQMQAYEKNPQGMTVEQYEAFLKQIPALNASQKAGRDKAAAALKQAAAVKKAEDAAALATSTAKQDQTNRLLSAVHAQLQNPTPVNVSVTLNAAQIANQIRIAQKRLL